MAEFLALAPLLHVGFRRRDGDEGGAHSRRARERLGRAEALLVSSSTVRTHVAHVPMKLDLRDRVQAVNYAYEAGLITDRKT